jgi:hypothetical protein
MLYRQSRDGQVSFWVRPERNLESYLAYSLIDACISNFVACWHSELPLPLVLTFNLDSCYLGRHLLFCNPMFFLK